MHRILSESGLTLNQLAKARAVNQSTIWRWTMKGVRGVKLESLAVGGVRVTSQEAFQRFIEALNPEASAAPPAPTPAELSQRQKRAAAVLNRAGV